MLGNSLSNSFPLEMVLYINITAPAGADYNCHKGKYYHCTCVKYTLYISSGKNQAGKEKEQEEKKD